MKKFSVKVVGLLFILSAVFLAACSIISPEGEKGGLRLSFNEKFFSSISSRDISASDEVPVKYTVEVLLRGDYKAALSRDYDSETFFSDIQTDFFIFEHIPVGLLVKVSVSVKMVSGSESRIILQGESDYIKINKGDNSPVIVLEAAASGSVSFDSGSFTLTTGDLSALAQNSIITLGAVDAAGKSVADSESDFVLDAQILYKGQDLVKLAPESGRYYYVSDNKVFLCGAENHIPAGSYQLYVTLTHPQTGIASSQTFAMTITDSFATPETQYALYQRPEGSNFTSFYLTDEEEVENASLSSETLETNKSSTAFDVSGNFYAFDGKEVVTSNPVVANNVDFNGDFSEYLSSYSDNWGLAIDLAKNNFYVYGINEQTIELFRCSSFISSGSPTPDDLSLTVSPSGFYAQRIAIYDDTLYALGSYNDGEASTYQLWVYDISSGLTNDSSVKYTISLDAKLPDALSYAKGTASYYGDMIALEGNLYLTVKALSSWTNANREIRNGALLRWIPGESDISVLGMADKVTSREDIAQLYFYETSFDKSPVYADADGQSLLAIIGSKYSQENNNGVLCNTYFPDVYAITSAADETAFAGPARFVALKPKKLVIADDGYAFYTDSAGELLYKAANRLVTVDLEEFVIESVKATKAYFEADMTDLLRSGITMDTIRAGGTYYDYNAAAWCLGSDNYYHEYSLSSADNVASIYLSVKEGQ